MKPMPRIEIQLDKIRHNAQILKGLCEAKGITVTGVVKGVCADPQIVNTFIEAGITSLAVSKTIHLEKLRKANIQATLTLLRTPGLTEVQNVVKFADISMNSEIKVIRALSEEAIRQEKVHKIIIMVEMGDLREGVMPKDLPDFIREVLKLPGIEIVGLGTNFACFGGVLPTEEKMQEFSALVQKIKNQFSLHLPIVSGGNSANINWIMETDDVGAINNVCLGEAILLGRETANGKLIPNLFPDAFKFVAEVIEAKQKPSFPFGYRGRNAFGESIEFQEQGWTNHILVSVGRQDVFVPGLTPMKPLKIIGASSDHIVMDGKNIQVQPGDEIMFAPNYGAMLSLMSSPYIHKTYIEYKGSKHEKQSSVYSFYKHNNENKIIQR
ncbi:MAG: alanine/ornithine racemase family PLP-dependent enzyme [Lysinibacillus sp.]|nr:alanine/ornithine racemase family PLP-dependent enzyme [Lysinibacillus sp.]